jgi:2-iminoacetate synthase
MGRTGEHFMEFSVPGFIKKLCSPNALLTLAEYLEDYASPETKVLGYNLIEDKIRELAVDTNVRTLKEKLDLVKQGRRDLYF